MSLRTRLTVWYMALLTLIVVALAAFVVGRLNLGLTGAVDRTLSGAAAQLRRGGDVDATAVSAAQVVVGGRVVAHRGALAATPLALAPGGPYSRRLADEDYRVRADAIGDGRLAVVAQSLDGSQDASDRVLTLIAIAGPAALLIAAAGGWWLAGKALRPLDAALLRLAGEVEQRERLVADASHELRSPLAAMRAELDVALDAGEPSIEVLESVREETDRLSKITADLLALARLDAGAVVSRREPVGLRELAGEVVASLQPRDGAIEVTGDGDALADRSHLRQALHNVVENAIKHGSAPVTIAIAPGELRIADAGPGIPAFERERVFERFARLDAARGRGGAGLGLAIARELIEEDGGALVVGPDSAFVFTLDVDGGA
ncbi:sensor histidine kinase [Solirubrobacter soli]|uniref:sensor histidine kinase n=1 Tax=Solirubrobacter soli TaxID=363832 RepID=UPI0004181FCC|nr:ATP-binding protein [Solirubrobacter soli]